MVKDGRFGPYITDGVTNITVPRSETIESLTHERAVELLAEKRAKGPAKRKTAAKKTTAKKSTAKKTTAKKSTTAKKTAAKKGLVLSSSQQYGCAANESVGCVSVLLRLA